ncbi:meiosis-specific protein ASY3 isoform X3 [Citrus clementina]|uniref:meiosis-specific protein ASY3 isoform X3 n=1 Tax=Citrus clementina TaxID=85681 RepID=UPI000CED0D9A|nr:meiosis-specific protein ASY3 isoform X3 [Citrus x clementina]
MGVDVRQILRDISEKEVDVRQKLQDDGMTRSQSFGSNSRPSSQLRKISIGITVDKKKPEAAEEDEAKIPNVERMNLNKEKSMQAENKCEGASAATKGKQSDATEEMRSPWITKRFFYKNAPISDTVPCTNQPSSGPATGGRQKKLNRVKDAQLAHSVQFFANHSSILRSGDSNQKKFNGITYSRKGGKNGSQVQVEEFTFATAQEAIVSDKVVAAEKTDKAENRTETLRTKLWQILATVSSPKSQPSNSQAKETGVDKLKPEQFVDQIGDRIVRPRQNSDTIETDSESPKQPTSRPLTRSLYRKRASTKVLQEKTKLGSSSNTKQKHQMNIYSFQDGRSANLDGAINFGSLMSTLKKGQIKKSIIEPHEISFAEKDNADEPQLASNKSVSPTHAEKTLDHKEDSIHGCPPQNKRDYFENNNKMQDNEFHQPSDLKKMNQRGDSLASAGTREHQEDCSNPSSKNVVEPPDVIESPTFAFKSPILSPSPCSTPRTVQMEQDVHDPPLKYRRFSLRAIRSFRALQTSKPDCSGSDAETESPGDAEELQHFSPRKPSPLKEKKDAEEDLAEFSSEDGDLGSSEDGSPIIKAYEYNRNISPEIHTSEEPNSMHCHTKRLCNHQGIRVDQFSPTSLSTKDNGEREWFLEPSEESQEDELARFFLWLSHCLLLV